MSIIVNETDNTLYGTRVADTDNIVFIPGSAITGTNEPTLYTSYNDFVGNHGDRSRRGCRNSGLWQEEEEQLREKSIKSYRKLKESDFPISYW